ncbi:hypothetical protein IF1G_09078 [Cordyceps javanica]|uniref:Uncharacterized protein n=1 Tax=Cordyceps javanica TaxID=43265 RepID=A0A545URC0_9HYPO|nr:hypothetical protein IF1G_09078 [Cordyceps javanica]
MPRVPRSAASWRYCSPFGPKHTIGVAGPCQLRPSHSQEKKSFFLDGRFFGSLIKKWKEARSRTGRRGMSDSCHGRMSWSLMSWSRWGEKRLGIGFPRVFACRTGGERGGNGFCCPQQG